MNKRIKEIEDQCWIYPTHPDMIEEDGNGNPRPCGFDSHKFAELIVEKCIEEAGEPADGLILGDTWHDGVRASVWSIQQYFGNKDEE